MIPLAVRRCRRSDAGRGIPSDWIDYLKFLNGGPLFKHSEAFSFQVATEDQAETDRYWNAIVGNGGTESLQPMRPMSSSLASFVDFSSLPMRSWVKKIFVVAPRPIISTGLSGSTSA